MSSTLHDGQLACRGSEVTFTCETQGSDAIAWRSDTYIGSGVQLVFVAAGSNQGDTRTSPSNTDTLATLTREEDDQGTLVLESTLRMSAWGFK